MNSHPSHPYASLVRYKQWADDGLHAVVAQNFNRIPEPDRDMLLKVLDHIHVVDRIFQHHLQGLPHAFREPRSEVMPAIGDLASGTAAVDDWYVSTVEASADPDFDRPVDFTFANGTPARMTRGEIVLHVCLHGTYHRGNAGLVLQKNGIAPNDDRMTDFLGTEDWMKPIPPSRQCRDLRSAPFEKGAPPAAWQSQIRGGRARFFAVSSDAGEAARHGEQT